MRDRISAQTAELFRFGVVGIALNLGLYLFYLVLTLRLAPTAAITVIYPLGAALSYFAHRRWTYRSGVRGLVPFLRYVSIFILGYLTNLALLAVLAGSIGLPHQLVQALEIPVP